MDNYEHRNVINGTSGEVWIDGEYIAEVVALEAKISFKKEEVLQSGNRDPGYKVTGREGKGTIKMNKVSSFFIKKLSEDILNLRTTTATIITKLSDPDGLGTERVELIGCTFDELTLADWEAGKLGEESMPFTFSSFKALDTI
ncbi:phage tail tube protein [Anaerovorax odorimutans]|uniref:Phage tail tube protein n=1 Tax=Anaerovorax odorimutans TaxID=109327 RepID=A0ABT1RR46_9FIRM|nr:phage tail tube protein [Anaerovorax odorimutans]MCQ4637671.1 phage tail tube protein [Anaerovorax odorimutans]